MLYMGNYVCRIASLDDIIKMYDTEIEQAEDKTKIMQWKQISIDRYREQSTIIYLGLLDDKIISMGSATLKASLVDNSEDIVDDNTAYLHGFFTEEEYQNQGYFSKLYKFMINDLIARGYTNVTLGVEKPEEKNKAIYFRWGFTEYIKTVPETYSDGSVIPVEYYRKKL